MRLAASVLCAVGTALSAPVASCGVGIGGRRGFRTACDTPRVRPFATALSVRRSMYPCGQQKNLESPIRYKRSAEHGTPVLSRPLCARHPVCVGCTVWRHAVRTAEIRELADLAGRPFGGGWHRSRCVCFVLCDYIDYCSFA